MDKTCHAFGRANVLNAHFLSINNDDHRQNYVFQSLHGFKRQQKNRGKSIILCNKEKVIKERTVLPVKILF